ncbi:MAG: histone deacetylase [Desulfosalsimonadaceae bacterium]|nr:histone deacetylase [Desulfosalsimonadaceae bacterium]
MTLRVGIARDERFLEHKTGHFHPEHPKRLEAVYRMIDRHFEDRLIPIPPEPATLEQMERIHSQAYIKRILKTADQRITSLAPDTPISAESYLAAWLAAGACVKGVDSLINGVCDAFFALVRPPGHHAMPDRASGFCLFNNIAIAARYALDRYDLGRVLVIDWDIHHGNGIHDIFYDSKEVLYFSTHDPMLFPYSGEISQTGGDNAKGYTVNVPIPRELTDDDMIYLYREILRPLIKGYQPRLIMVAAGFDAHTDDPIGRSRLTESAYQGITRLLMEFRALADLPPLFFALEGGYNQRALADSIQAVLMELTTGPTPSFEISPSQTALDLVAQVRSLHAPYGVFHD